MSKIEKIAVIGEGKMGSSIFLYLNSFKFKLYWLCSSEAESDKARKTWYKKTKLQYQSGIISEEEFIIKSETTIVTNLVTNLKDCDLIIEAISEDMSAKRKLFEILDNCISPNCIFTSNSSSILPSLLVPSADRSDKFAGMHFFFPVALKTTVELITNDSTSLQTKETLDHFLKQIGKKSFVQNEANAFILNRLLLDFQAGAYLIFLEGQLSYNEIDELVRLYIFPIGVFEFFDQVGIDVMLSSIKSYTQNETNKEFYYPLIKKLEELVALKHLGVKTKQGFYDYTKRESEDKTIQNRKEDKDFTNKNATDLLWNYYIGSVSRITETGLCSKEDLAHALKDYLGIDTDPLMRIIP